MEEVTKKEEFKPHPYQKLYRAGKEYDFNMYLKYKETLRALWIRPMGDDDKQVYVCSEGERLRLASMLATEASLWHGMRADSAEYAIYKAVSSVKMTEFLDYFMLRPLVNTGRCFIAGGAVMRYFLSVFRKEATDFRSMFTENDIDVFFNDEADINTFLFFLKSKNVDVEKVEGGKHHTYRVSSKVGYFTHPWVVQFTKTVETDLHRLIEDFDLPMCQIGVGRSGNLRYSIGFDVWLSNINNAVVHVTSYKDNSVMRKDYSARLDKYEGMGFMLKRAGENTYYGRRPSSMDYTDTADFVLTHGNQNDKLLVALYELYLEGLNKHRTVYLANIVKKHLAIVPVYVEKRELYFDDMACKKHPDDAKKRRDFFKSQMQYIDKIVFHDICNEIEQEFVASNTFSYDGVEKRTFMDSIADQIAAKTKHLAPKVADGVF